MYLHFLKKSHINWLKIKKLRFNSLLFPSVSKQMHEVPWEIIIKFKNVIYMNI